jgi:hypothetical protein
MDKDDEPKPVADYWINPAFKKRQPGPRDVIIPTGGRGYSHPHRREARREEGRPAEVTSILVAGVALSMSTQAG